MSSTFDAVGRSELLDIRDTKDVSSRISNSETIPDHHKLEGQFTSLQGNPAFKFGSRDRCIFDVSTNLVTIRVERLGIHL